MLTKQVNKVNSKTFYADSVDYNPDLLVYGSDHCCNKFNGIIIQQALEQMKEDSEQQYGNKYNSNMKE